MLEEDAKSIFTHWLQTHGASVLQVARAYTLTKEESQDLAQEILLQSWRSLPNFAGQASPATWFYRVAAHGDELAPRRPPATNASEASAGGAVARDGVGRRAQRVEQRERVERLYEAIHQLPPTDIALVLLYLDELSYREMANVLGISESNVGVRLNRAKKTLAKLLDAEPVEGKADESR